MAVTQQRPSRARNEHGKRANCAGADAGGSPVEVVRRDRRSTHRTASDGNEHGIGMSDRPARIPGVRRTRILEHPAANLRRQAPAPVVGPVRAKVLTRRL
jgi:hypothetical protein